MKIVGRNNEKDGLMQCLISKRPEMVKLLFQKLDMENTIFWRKKPQRVTL